MFKKEKTIFCALTLYLNATGNTSPKYEYKADAKSLFTCSLTKKKYKLSEINKWFMTEGVQNLVKQGYTGKWMAKTQQIENPKPYDKGDFQMVLSFIMIKPYKPQPNVDGMKPIGQTIPQYREVSMTQAQPSAPEYAKPVEKIDEMDDDIPF